MNENLPFIRRKYYRNEAPSSEKVLLEAAHEQARQYLSRAIAAACRGAADCGKYREAAGTVALDPTVASCSRTSNSRWCNTPK
jgi:hypothetical protein